MHNRTINPERMLKLRVFAAIVAHGSMTKAAKALGISRSVVSGHLKHLEADLGVQLIERTTRSMRVTHIGEQVHDRVRVMLDAGQAALDLVDAHLGAVRGRLRVAFPVDLGRVALVDVIAELQLRHPELRIEALLGDRPIDLLRDGVDIAVRVGVPHDSGLILHRLCPTEEIFIASPALVAERGLVSVEALAEMPRIAHSVVDQLTSTLRHPDGRTVDLTMAEPVVSVASSDLMQALVHRGVGMAMIPELFVREPLRTGALVQLAAPWSRRRVEVYALTPSRVTSPAVVAFFEALRRTLGQA